MLNVITVSASDQNVAMRAAGEIITKIKGGIIRVIEQEQPLLVLHSKPIKCVLPGITYSFGESDGSEVCVCYLGSAGINEIDI